jgi:hypothetical protein
MEGENNEPQGQVEPEFIKAPASEDQKTKVVRCTEKENAQLSD